MASRPRKRTSHVQLPSAEDMHQLTAAEARRPLAAGKNGVQYADFSSVKAVCEHFAVAHDLFAMDDRPPADILEQGARLTGELVQRILAQPLTPPAIDLLNHAYSYLSESDTPDASDIIFVFGGRTMQRIRTATELYKHGLAPTLLLSGQGPIYGSSADTPEAETYASFAAKAGVPEPSIITETKSVSLVDNIRSSLNMLDASGKSFDSIIIVNSPYAQRRGWCMWRKYLPDDIPIYRVNSQTKPELAADAWFRSEQGLQVIFGEYVKLRAAVAFDDA